jgi:protein-disulfide isomerase-like protein with CxxC motif
MHELTHAWQAERTGVRYLLQALQAQMKLGPQVYEYGGESAVRAATAAGKTLAEFNVEQQAEIARDFYMHGRHGLDVSAWMPFAAELSRAIPPP